MPFPMNRPPIRSLHDLRRRLRALLRLQSSEFHMKRTALASAAAHGARRGGCVADCER